MSPSLKHPQPRGWAGRTALITGGASGIGAAIGGELLRGGGCVVLADIDRAALEQQARDLAATYGADVVAACPLDVTDRDAFRSVVDEVIERFGRLDLLFNNAGVSVGGPTDRLTGAHWDRAIDVNLGGVVNGVLAAYPRLREQGHGHIVNTASGAGLVALPFVAPYSAAKHAVVGLSLALRPEAALGGVHVSVVCPAAVETPILDQGTPADLPPALTTPITARDFLAVARTEPVPAVDAARLALRGVARNRAVIVVPRSAKVPWLLHRLSPALALRVTGALARRADEQLVAPRR